LSHLGFVDQQKYFLRSQCYLSFASSSVCGSGVSAVILCMCDVVGSAAAVHGTVASSAHMTCHSVVLHARVLAHIAAANTIHTATTLSVSSVECFKRECCLSDADSKVQQVLSNG
jgi:hypothetical protein